MDEVEQAGLGLAGWIISVGSLVQSLGQEDPLREGIETHSSIAAWRIPWTKEPGGLQSTGSQRVRHDWSNLSLMHALRHRDGPYLSGTWLWSDESRGIVAWSVNSLKEVFAVWALDRLVYIWKMSLRRKSPKEGSEVGGRRQGRRQGRRTQQGLGLSRARCVQQIHARQTLMHQVNSSRKHS